MRTTRRRELIERLVRVKGRDGGWSYTTRTSSVAEPTAWACIALSAHGVPDEDWRSGLDSLARTQRGDGGVPVSAELDSPCWATAPAVLSWLRASPRSDERDRAGVDRGVEWLLRTRGQPIPPNAEVYGHDTTKIGWSWVEGTHSWVEPTAYAVLALAAADRGDHPRVREGRALLLDRAIPGGGWNYGNARIFDKTLRPFPGTTGVALLALTGRGSDDRVEAGLDYLMSELPKVRAPMSLAWGVMALSAWDRRPSEAADWLDEAAGRTLATDPNPLYDALLLLADRVPCPLVSVQRTVEAVHG